MDKSQKRSIHRHQKGQGMTEYIIIVVAVALLSLVVVTQFGNQIRNLFIAAGDELATGEGSIENRMDADGADEYEGLHNINEN
jgi:Flp pilus assembly pilin Flp